VALHGRRVCVIDGTTVTAADTDANRKSIHQRIISPGRLASSGPLVGLFSLATPPASTPAIGPYSGKGAGETTLARPLIERH